MRFFTPFSISLSSNVSFCVFISLVFGAPAATSAPFGFNTTTSSASAFGAQNSTQPTATSFGGFNAATSAPTFGFNTPTTSAAAGLGGAPFGGFGLTVPAIGATIPGRFARSHFIAA